MDVVLVEKNKLIHVKSHLMGFGISEIVLLSCNKHPFVFKMTANLKNTYLEKMKAGDTDVETAICELIFFYFFTCIFL